jgi:hypothetical protein
VALARGKKAIKLWRFAQKTALTLWPTSSAERETILHRRDLLRRRCATLKKGDRFAVDDDPYFSFIFFGKPTQEVWLRRTFFQAAPLVKPNRQVWNSSRISFQAALRLRKEGARFAGEESKLRRIACDGGIASFNKTKNKAYAPLRNACPDNTPLFNFLFMNGTEDGCRCKEDRIEATKSYKRRTSSGRNPV